MRQISFLSRGPSGRSLLPDALRLAVVLLCTLAPRVASAYSAAEVHALTSARCGPHDRGDEVVEVVPFSALTAASTAGGSSDPLVCNPLDPGFGVPTFAGAVAGASLRGGWLSAYGEAGGGPTPAPGDITLSDGTGIARIWDTVTVSGSGPTFSFLARILLHVEGEITGFAGVNAAVFIIGANVQSVGCVGTYYAVCGGVMSPQGAFSFDLVLDVPVSSSSPTFQLLTELTASAVNEGIANASSTATLSIQLPPGFTFTSGSGVLLVPEPPTLVLAALGAAGLALYARAGAARSSRSRSRSVAS